MISVPRNTYGNLAWSNPDGQTLAVLGPFFRVQAPPWGSRRLWLSRSSSSSGMPARSGRRGDAYICALGRGLRVGLVKKSDSGAKNKPP